MYFVCTTLSGALTHRIARTRMEELFPVRILANWPILPAFLNLFIHPIKGGAVRLLETHLSAERRNGSRCR